MPEVPTAAPQGPSVTVVMPVYNPDVNFLRQALESVRIQRGVAFEVIVVDDGSAAPQDWIPEEFSDMNLRVLRQSNGGPGRARNAGITCARGPYVALLDADDVWLPGKLARQAQLLDDNPGVGLVYSPVEKIDGDGRTLGASRHEPLSGHVLEGLFWRNFVPTSTVMVRKSALDQVGGFDEDRALVAVEDYDLWLRVAARFAVMAIREPTTRYRMHAQGISRDVGRSYRGEALVVERAVARFGTEHPALVAGRSRRLAQVHVDWAEELVSLRRTQEARAPLTRALKFSPLCRKAWALYVASFLSAGTLDRIRQVRSWL